MCMYLRIYYLVIVPISKSLAIGVSLVCQLEQLITNSTLPERLLPLMIGWSIMADNHTYRALGSISGYQIA